MRMVTAYVITKMSDENAWWKLLIGHFSGRDCLVNCEIDIMAGLVLFGREVEELYYREADSGIISSPARDNGEGTDSEGAGPSLSVGPGEVVLSNLVAFVQTENGVRHLFRSKPQGEIPKFE